MIRRTAQGMSWVLANPAAPSSVSTNDTSSVSANCPWARFYSDFGNAVGRTRHRRGTADEARGTACYLYREFPEITLEDLNMALTASKSSSGTTRGRGEQAVGAARNKNL